MYVKFTQIEKHIIIPNKISSYNGLKIWKFQKCYFCKLMLNLFLSLRSFTSIDSFTVKILKKFGLKHNFFLQQKLFFVFLPKYFVNIYPIIVSIHIFINENYIQRGISRTIQDNLNFKWHAVKFYKLWLFLFSLFIENEMNLVLLFYIHISCMLEFLINAVKEYASIWLTLDFCLMLCSFCNICEISEIFSLKKNWKILFLKWKSEKYCLSNIKWIFSIFVAPCPELSQAEISVLPPFLILRFVFWRTTIICYD